MCKALGSSSSAEVEWGTYQGATLSDGQSPSNTEESLCTSSACYQQTAPTKAGDLPEDPLTLTNLKGFLCGPMKQKESILYQVLWSGNNGLFFPAVDQLTSEGGTSAKHNRLSAVGHHLAPTAEFFIGRLTGDYYSLNLIDVISCKNSIFFSLLKGTFTDNMEKRNFHKDNQELLPKDVQPLTQNYIKVTGISGTLPVCTTFLP